MRQLQPVLWTKGTLLTPQHLQTQDRFLEDTLRFWLESLSFCPWGFRELRIDRESLDTGLLNITSASGILPDGLLFDIPDADSAPPVKSLAEHFGPNESTLDVYLAVPHYRDRGTNVSPPGATTDTRFVAEVAMVRNEMRAADEKPVQIARKGFRLLTANESRQGHSTLRIARVKRSAAGPMQLDDHFVPPLLDLAASDYLMTIGRRILEILTTRSTELSALRRQKNQSLADFTSAEIASFWLLYTVNTHFPIFRHLFESRRGHPEDLYSAMISLAGALTTFSPDMHPRDLPVYDHEDLGGCFTALDAKLRLLLDTVLPKNYVTLKMAQVQPSIYATALADERLFDRTTFYLALRADMDHGEMIREVPRLVKIGSSNQLDEMVRRALPALELRHMARPPAALPIKLNYEYFLLGRSGTVWDSIARSHNLAAYVPGDFPSPELELVVVLPEAR